MILPLPPPMHLNASRSSPPAGPAAPADAGGDLGPLAWVMEELRKCLELAGTALRRQVREQASAGGAADAGSLPTARLQLHQTAGARLSDSAGAALGQIDQVSRRLAELIEQIAQSAAREAQAANGVAGNIQHIFTVTEQTGEGTRSTASQVRELSRIADELRLSVERFKIA